MTLLRLFSLISTCLALANAASLTQVSHFGHNPTNATMYIYVPDKLPHNPTIILGIHWCHGTAIDFYNGTQWANIADTKGFIVIYPNSPNSFDECWDVASKQTLTHDGGGDSESIANMVKYTISKYKTDSQKVFVTGVSSGAMMTNVMAAVYPELFSAGSAYSGVAAGCFSGPDVDYWNTDCATGLVTKTGREWAAIVKAMYRGYRGQYPRMQLWHGTADDVLFEQNLPEETKEWTTVLGVAHVHPLTSNNSPLTGYTRVNYGGKVESILAQDVGHTVPVIESETLKWFGI